MPADVGSYFAAHDREPLTPEERQTSDAFHELFYERWRSGAGNTIGLSWFGHKTIKSPTDIWMYQELLVRARPDVVVETGTHGGGSALFMAMVMDQLDHGQVITVDIEAPAGRPEHPRIQYLVGSSTDPAIVADIHARVAGRRAMVILDSDHRAAHVIEELHAYAPLVRVGDHLIVEDTNVNGHPAWADFGPGPMEARDEFLAGTDDFVTDETCERFLLTLNPRGYLRRVARAEDDRT